MTQYKKSQLVIYGSSSKLASGMAWEQSRTATGAPGRAGMTGERLRRRDRESLYAKVGKIESALYSCGTRTAAQMGHAGAGGATELHADGHGWGDIYTEDISCELVKNNSAERGNLYKFIIVDPYTNKTEDVAFRNVCETNIIGILLIKTLNDMNVRISLQQYMELTGNPQSTHGGATKNVNKRIKNSRYKKSKRR